ncbi:MAG: adenylylsulfate kinase, partial [Colwellia sp.]
QIHVKTDTQSVEQCAEQIVSYLMAQDFITTASLK